MLIERNGARLFALEAGAGEPALVFVHGNGADHTAFHHQIAHFSPLTRVVALDQRGHGQSGRDPEGIYSQEKYVDDLRAMLDTLRIERAILVGWSVGGSIAARFTGDHLSRVAGVVLVDHNVDAAKPELGLDPGYAKWIVQGLAEDFEGTGHRRYVDSWFPETGALYRLSTHRARGGLRNP
jgi:pimeloyl-ACP methyl ester carboxylesterase